MIDLGLDFAFLAGEGRAGQGFTKSRDKTVNAQSNSAMRLTGVRKLPNHQPVSLEKMDLVVVACTLERCDCLAQSKLRASNNRRLLGAIYGVSGHLKKKPVCGYQNKKRNPSIYKFSLYF